MHMEPMARSSNPRPHTRPVKRQLVKKGSMRTSLKKSCVRIARKEASETHAGGVAYCVGLCVEVRTP
jgi:hypothetical protein